MIMIRIINFIIILLTWGMVEIIEVDYSNDIHEHRSDLANHSLYDIFISGNMFDDYQLVTNGEFSDGTTNKTAIQSTISASNGIITATSIVSSGEYGFTNTPLINGNKYYHIASIKSATSSNIRMGSDVIVLYTNINNFQVLSGIAIITGTVNRLYKIAVTLGATFEGDYYYTFNISTLIANKQYSPMFNTTFDLMSDANIKSQMDRFVQYKHEWLDFDTLEWYPTQQELEDAYTEYQTNLNMEPYERFETTTNVLDISDLIIIMVWLIGYYLSFKLIKKGLKKL